MTIRVFIKNEYDSAVPLLVEDFQTLEPAGRLGVFELDPGDQGDFYLHGGNYLKITEQVG